MTLLEIIERVESATWADREIDALITAALNDAGYTRPQHHATTGDWVVIMDNEDGHPMDFVNPPRFTASLDAALTLVPEGWRRSFTDDSDDLGGCIGELWTAKHNAWANAATPALALCAASLKARASLTPERNG